MTGISILPKCFSILRTSILIRILRVFMELVYAHQVGFQQILQEDFDLFIAVSGYESRSVYLAENLSSHQCEKIVLGFDDRKNVLSRPENDLRYMELGFTYYELPGNNSSEITNILDGICMKNGCRGMKILVDYSCMSKTWLTSIIHYFSMNELMVEDSEVYFSYTPSYFDSAKNLDKKQITWNLPGYFRTPGKPISVIIGLGYEKLIGESVFNSLRNFTKYVFYSNPAFDNRFVEEVLANNAKILKKLDEEKIFNYPIQDLKETDALLTSLSLELRLNHRLVLISMGPKPFTLSCLLLAARYPDIHVWNISSSVTGNVYNRDAMGEPLVCKTLFSSKDEVF